MDPFNVARLPSATAWRFGYLIAQGGLSLALFGILAHVLPTHAFAAAAVAQGVLVVAQAIGDFGLSQAAVTALPAQIAAEPEREPELVRGAASLYALASIAALAITLLAILAVPAAAGAPVAVIAPAAAVTVLVSGADGLLRARGEFRRPVVLVTISRLGGFAGVAVAAADKSATAACAGITAGILVASIPAALVVYRAFTGARRGSAAELRRAALPLGLAQLFVIGSGRVDTILTSAISGTVVGAGFESTWRVYQLAQYVVGGIATAAAPFIADALGSQRSEQARSLIRRVGTIVVGLGVVLAAGLLALAGPTSRLLFGHVVGPRVAHALPPLAILTPLSFAAFFATVVLAASPADRWWILPANAIGAIVNVGLVFSLASGGSLTRATLACAIGLTAGSLVLVARLAIFVRRMHGPATDSEIPAPPTRSGLRVLVLTTRFPQADGRGDQVRAMLHLAYLSEHHNVTVLSAEAPRTDASLTEAQRLARVEVVSASPARRALSALACLARGRPAQVGWMMPGPSWRTARSLAVGADVVLANTSRALRGGLPAPIVLDHIDALSHNMAERARGPEPLPVRAFAALEARLLRAWERRLAEIAAAQIGASRRVAELLQTPDDHVHVLPNGWTREVFSDPPGHTRDIDVIFTGNMDYPPNRDGARWLAREILPAVRAARASTSAWIVGRDADRVALDGVEIAADVPDVLAYLRRARVAVAPVYGAGSPSKTLEAAASGAAVVSTPWGLECYGLPGPAVEDTEAFAARIVELLTDEDRRRELVAEQSAAVAALAPAALGPRLEQIVAQAAHAGSRATAPGRRLPRPQAISVGALAVCAVSLSVALTALPSGNLSLARPAPVIPARTAHCIPTRQPPPTARVLPTQVPALNPKRVYILVFQTNCGLLWMKLDVTTSPRLAANVTALANAHFYNGLTFYRIAPGFLIQAGTGSRAPLGHGFTIVDPPPARETYPPWTVAMANDGTVPAGTAGSDVFIVLPGSANLPRSFAVLGTLAAGMDVAEAIAAVPAQPPGDGVPTMPIVIEHAGVFSR